MTRARHRLRNVVIHPAARLTRARAGKAGTTVLVMQPDHLGDILLSQPAVRLIREQYPDRRIVGVVGPWSEWIARMAWPVDDIVTIEFPGFERAVGSGNLLDPYINLSRYARRLRGLEAGIAFVLRPDAWWAAWLASIVANGAVVTSNDPVIRPFATQQVNVNPRHHATLQAAKIAKGLDPRGEDQEPDTDSLALSIQPQPDGNAQAVELLRRHGILGDYVVLHPGSGADVKLWPADRWRDVVRRLNEWNVPVLITGSHSEATLTAQIAAHQRCAIDLAGTTPLPLLTELLRRARLVLGTDNGPLHLAVACHTPTIHLFGPSSPERYGPWGPADRHRVISGRWSCPRCGDLSTSRPEGCGCMLAISTESVITAAHEMLDLHAAS